MIGVSEAKEFLAVESANINEGCQKRTICPFCKAKHENSFVIRKNEVGEVTGYCHRSSCSGRFVSLESKCIRFVEGGPKFHPRFYEKELIEVPAIVKDWLFDMYTLTKQDIVREGIRFNDETQRLYFPIFDWLGQTWGGVAKASAPECYGPKWLTYYEKDVIKLHFPRNFERQPRLTNLVAVEDVISSIRVSSSFPTVCLLGTHMTPEQASYLAGLTDTLTLALDPDAVDKMVKIERTYRALFKNGIKIKILACDPKDYGAEFDLIQDLTI